MKRAVYLYCFVPSKLQEQLLWKMKGIEMNHDSPHRDIAASPQARMKHRVSGLDLLLQSSIFPDAKTSGTAM